MKTLTLVKFANDVEQLWWRVPKEDIVESFENNSLKEVTRDIVEKYNIKDGDRKDKFEDNEDFEEALENCEPVDIYLEDMINVSDIKEDSLYFDNYNDEFFLGSDVLSWETQKYYYYHDGSNWRMKEISESKDIEAKYIGNENYTTGRLERYELENGKQFIIDSSMYQGAVDNVTEEYNEIIDEA